MEEISKYLEGFEKLIAAIIAGGGIIWLYGSKLFAVCRSIGVLGAVYRRLGSATADELYEAIQTARKANCALDLRQQALERHCNVGVYVCNSEGKCEWANEVFCELHGLDLGSIRGLGWLAAVIEAERFEVHRRWIECVKSGVPWSTDYTVTNQRTHETYRCHTEAHALVVDDEPTCYVGTVKRLT